MAKLSLKQLPSNLLSQQIQDAKRHFLHDAYWAEYYKFRAEFYEREMYRLESLRLKGDFE